MHKKHKKEQMSFLNNLDEKCFEQNQHSTSSLFLKSSTTW